MSFLSGLKVFGQGIEKVFGWLGSPKGQNILSTGEAVVEGFVPASAPVINLFNSWAAKAYTVEALAVAAKAEKAGPDKAVAVMQSMTPQILTYAQQEGLSPRTAAQIQTANDAAIAFIKAMTEEPAQP